MSWHVSRRHYKPHDIHDVIPDRPITTEVYVCRTSDFAAQRIPHGFSEKVVVKDDEVGSLPEYWAGAGTAFFRQDYYTIRNVFRSVKTTNRQHTLFEY